MSEDNRKYLIPQEEISNKVTEETVQRAENFGRFLAKKNDDEGEALTTSQLRKFFGEVKRQQMNGFEQSELVMLKPKLAYAVGRAKNGNAKKKVKIEVFYDVMADAIDKVMKSPNKEKAFKNFIAIFEAIVAYHKKYEENNK